MPNKCSTVDMAVWLVNRNDRTHRIYFPGQENAERWLVNHTREQWEIVPISDEENQRLRRAAKLDYTFMRRRSS